MGGKETQAAGRAAETIAADFARLSRDFEALTHRARVRFEQRDWRGMQADAVERLDLYPRVVGETLAELRSFLQEHSSSRGLWKAIRSAYAARVAREQNDELARTFFNSVTRKIFSTVGVNPEVEFFSLDARRLDTPDPTIVRRYPGGGDLEPLFREVLDDYTLDAPWREVAGDAYRVARQVAADLAAHDVHGVDAVEFIRPMFFRNKGAYIIGRLRAGHRVVPLVVALVHPEDGVAVDAVLTEEALVSIVFSFARSYFHVETERPRDLIAFLKSILPLKPVAELYVSLGFNKHGKTELYRDLQAHLSTSRDQFRIAPGARGLVMIAFTLSGYDVIFKVIRDRFPLPKHTSRREVMEQYRLVFKRDRVGRLVDAQEFEHLQFEKALFMPDLLQELTGQAASTVQVNGDKVVIHHLYTERRVTPLDLYLRAADEAAARRAVIDYGNAIRELAKANIFPGDFVLKNFGVTRHGRVVFYDYDELCLLTDCRFRRLPVARTPEEELDPEPWFRIDDRDIFPEEFAAFLEFGGALRRIFVERHGDLLTVGFWRDLQERNRRGEIMEFFPYPESKRLGAG